MAMIVRAQVGHEAFSGGVRLRINRISPTSREGGTYRWLDPVQNGQQRSGYEISASKSTRYRALDDSEAKVTKVKRETVSWPRARGTALD